MQSNNIYNVDLKLYQKFFKNQKNKTYIEIGSLDGISNNISYFFEKNLNWSGYLFEINSQYISQLKHNRPKNKIFNISIGNNQLLEIKSNEFIQSIEYQRIINKSIDLLILNQKENQLNIIHSILKSTFKPNYMIIDFLFNKKQQIKKILENNYILDSQINEKYLVFKKIPSILLITRCTRPKNLIRIKDSIINGFKNTKVNFFWYIIVQGKKVSKENFIKYNFSEKNIRYVYKISSGHFLFSGQFLNDALFDQSIYCDYTYILDDDNLIHYNFPKIIQDEINDRKQIIVINLQNLLGDINDINNDCKGKIDAANFLIRTDILRNLNGYQLTPYFVKTGWAEDALTFKHLIENNIPITYTHKYCAYHNGIDYLK